MSTAPACRSSRRCRATKVPPIRLIRLLVIAVAISSRRSRCRAIGGAEPLAQRRRKVADHVVGEMRIVRQVRGQDLVVEPDLAVGEQHRDLRPGQPMARRGALGQGLLVRQELDGAVEPPLPLQQRGSAGPGCRGRRSPPPRSARSPASAGSCRAAPGRRPRRSSRPASGCAAWSSGRPRRRRRRAGS